MLARRLAIWGRRPRARCGAPGRHTDERRRRLECQRRHALRQPCRRRVCIGICLHLQMYTSDVGLTLTLFEKDANCRQSEQRIGNEERTNWPSYY